MTSTSPTTSADKAGRIALAAAIAAFAAIVCFGSARQAYAALAGSGGAAALQKAQAAPRGAGRDGLLHSAQSQLRASLEVSPGNAQAWLDLARTRHLQATGAEVATVSPTLAAAAADAARRAAALRPGWSEPPARLAQALALTPETPIEEVAAALKHSYQIAAFDERMLAWRPDVAFGVWAGLDLETQASALLEACAYVRAGEGRHEELAARADAHEDRVAAAAMRSVVTDVACWRPSPEAATNP